MGHPTGLRTKVAGPGHKRTLTLTLSLNPNPSPGPTWVALALALPGPCKAACDFHTSGYLFSTSPA